MEKLQPNGYFHTKFYNFPPKKVEPWSHRDDSVRMGFSSRCCDCCRVHCRPRGCTGGVCACSLGSPLSVSSKCVPAPSLSCVSFGGEGCWLASSYACRPPAGHTASSTHPEKTGFRPYTSGLFWVITLVLFDSYCHDAMILNATLPVYPQGPSCAHSRPR